MVAIQDELLSGDLGQGVKRRPVRTIVAAGHGDIGHGSLHLHVNMAARSIAILNVVDSCLAVEMGDGIASLCEVRRKTVNATLGEAFTARLAGMLIAIARVVQLGASVEVLDDEGIRFPSHRGGCCVLPGGVVFACFALVEV